jgi:hypothetical protein
MYVFGIDVPLMEVLFVFSILYVVALVVTFLEVRKLRQIIVEERLDLRELTQDVVALNSYMQKSEIKKYKK